MYLSQRIPAFSDPTTVPSRLDLEIRNLASSDEKATTLGTVEFYSYNPLVHDFVSRGFSW